MANIPFPRTWLSNEQVTASKLNTDVRDGFGFLLSPPLCILRKNANQQFFSGTAADVTWQIEDVDTDGSHSNVSNTNRFTAQTAGWYYFNATIAWNPGTPNGMREITIVKNGNNTTRQSRSDDFPEWVEPSSTTTFSIHNTRGYVQLNVADYIVVQAFQDSGLTINIVPSDTRWTVRWVRT